MCLLGLLVGDVFNTLRAAWADLFEPGIGAKILAFLMVVAALAFGCVLIVAIFLIGFTAFGF